MLIFRKYVNFFAVQEKKQKQKQKTTLICGVS